jgi:hypothetical protein
MKWIKKHWRGLARGITIPLFAVGVFCGYWWFYKLAPIRSTLEPEWRFSHTPRAYWHEVQKGIHNGFWSHDDGFTVGKYGDMSWAELIMARVKPGTNMGCMGAGPTHSESSMRYITNQPLGERADDWIAWWQENGSKTQMTWIQEGFQKQGFEVNIPPTLDQIPVLLNVLGTIEPSKQSTLPKAIRYNAFRCLRDRGFEPVTYAIENKIGSEDVKNGLIEYARMERLWPAKDGVGILPFGTENKEVSWEGYPRPVILTTKFQVKAYMIIFGLPLLGLIILIGSFRHGNYNNASKRTASTRSA